MKGCHVAQSWAAMWQRENPKDAQQPKFKRGKGLAGANPQSANFIIQSTTRSGRIQSQTTLQS
jgi:hypothetical protein